VKLEPAPPFRCTRGIGKFLLLLLALGTFTADTSARSSVDIRVPQDVAALQLAIAQARPGDRILLDAGTYPGGNVVPSAKHDITIAGVDRNAVVLDGGDRRRNGIVVHGDGVSILNMSAHNFLENAFYWNGADRFRASYLTAWNVRGYGIYIEDGEDGVIDHSYVSGAADAAYYIGECRPCRATIANVVAVRSAVGYSGTNSTGVLIRDSIWRGNGAGIVPNTFANEALPPEQRTTIVRNVVTRSGREPVPIHTAIAGFIGIGIAVAGGFENVVRDNRVTASERYGVAVFSTARYVTFNPQTPEPGPRWRPRGNRVTGNVVTASGRADLALASGSGPRNCFAANTVRKTLPTNLQTADCTSASPDGDRGVAAVVTAPVQEMFRETLRRRKPPDFSSLPPPPPQPNMG
jgi:Right handed beta helix region